MRCDAEAMIILKQNWPEASVDTTQDAIYFDDLVREAQESDWFEEYLALVSATTGLPLALCREHAGKLERALAALTS